MSNLNVASVKHTKNVGIGGERTEAPFKGQTAMSAICAITTNQEHVGANS